MFSYALSVCFISDFLFYVGEIVLVIGILDMSEEFSSFLSQVHSSSKEIPGGSHFLRVDIGHGDHAASE